MIFMTIHVKKLGLSIRVFFLKTDGSIWFTYKYGFMIFMTVHGKKFVYFS